MSENALLWLYGGSALVAAIVFAATVRSPGLVTFRAGLLIYLTGTAWWAAVDIWRWIAGTSSLQIVEAWTLPAAAIVVAGVRVCVLAATRPGWKASRHDVLSLAAHPILALVAAATPPLWRFVAAEGADGSIEYGPVFWASSALAYGLLVAATIDLFRARSTGGKVAMRAVPVVALIWIVPLVASVVTMAWGGPNGVDLMPPGFALTALLIWKTLVPAEVGLAVTIARSQVLEELADAVIVLGARDQILDANAAALRLVGAEQPASAFVNKTLRATWPSIADAALFSGEHDLILATAGDVVLDVTVTPLSEASGAPRGRAVVLRDVTDAVRQRRELAQLRAELADQAVSDAVTGLHNRRYAEQVVPEMLARSAAKGVPMSIAMIDVDHFKVVNDTYGHPVGDRVLRALASVMLEEVPAAMLARIGGEEFLVMMPGLSIEMARDRTERLREVCAQAGVLTREGAVQVTVSAGVATTSERETTLEGLMEAADSALYRAKREGRDRTCVAPPVEVSAGMS